MINAIYGANDTASNSGVNGAMNPNEVPINYFTQNYADIIEDMTTISDDQIQIDLYILQKTISTGRNCM